MKQFRLLQLPSLALQAVLEFLDPFELFDLSQCSRKSAAIVPLGGTRQYELSFTPDGARINGYSFKADLQRIDMLLGKRRFLLNDGKEIVVYVGCTRGRWNNLNFYFVDRNLGLRVILFHLVELFGCRVDTINLRYHSSLGIHQPIIEWVIEKQKENKSLIIGHDNLNEHELRWVLDNLPISYSFECAVQTSFGFEYKFKTYPKMLHIQLSHWFKLDDLLAAAKSCIVIHFFQSNLENKGVDIFMKAWASGEFPTLRYLEVGGDNLNERDQILGRKPAEWWKPTANILKLMINCI